MNDGDELVRIGCALQHGLVMEVGAQRVTLQGTHSIRRIPGRSTLPYAITPVSGKFWAAWLARNSDLEFVRKGLVFAEASATT